MARSRACLTEPMVVPFIKQRAKGRSKRTRKGRRLIWLLACGIEMGVLGRQAIFVSGEKLTLKVCSWDLL